VTVISEPVATERDATAELVPGTGTPLGETLALCHDRPTGLTAAIAVDDTTLGPGLGGVRWMPYASFSAAVEEACRLSRVMTLKNALADIPYGGAKSVIMRQEGGGGPAGRGTTRGTSRPSDTPNCWPSPPPSADSAARTSPASTWGPPWPTWP
jgi:hypothetical protein